MAIFILLGGTAWAAGTIGPGDLQRDAVRGKHIKKGVVHTSDVANASLTGRDIALDEFTEVLLGGTNSDCNPGAGTTNWVNVAAFDDATRSTLAFYRDPLGVVHIKGTIRCLSGSDVAMPIFTLPVGYRPALTEEFPTVAGSPRALNSIVVTGAGEVSPGAATGTGALLSLNGLSFRCSPSGTDGCP